MPFKGKGQMAAPPATPEALYRDLPRSRMRCPACGCTRAICCEPMPPTHGHA